MSTHRRLQPYIKRWYEFQVPPVWKSWGSAVFLVTLTLGLTLLATEPDVSRGRNGRISHRVRSVPSSLNGRLSDQRILYIFNGYNISRPYWSDLFNEPWQSLSSIYSEGYLFAAFYDDRDMLDPPWTNGTQTPGPPVVLVLGAMETSDVRVLCFLWYRYKPRPDIMLARKIPVSGHTLSYIRAYLFYCEPTSTDHQPGDEPPEYVSLITENTVVPSNLIPVQLPPNPGRPLSVCVCAGPYRGHYNVFQLVERLEALSLLGAKLVVLYNRTIDAAGHAVLDLYTTKPNYQIVEIPNFLESEYQAGLDDIFTGVMLNHCLLTNMYRCRSLISQDDLVIVAPKQLRAYQDMPFVQLRHGVQKDSHYIPVDPAQPSSYLLPVAYFPLDVNPVKNEALPKYLTTPRYFTRTVLTSAPTNVTSPVSSLLHPLGCLYMANGRCAKPRYTYNHKQWLVSPVSSEAVALYYSYCDDIPMKPQCSNSTITNGTSQTLQDSWMARYGPDLFVQTAQVLDTLSLLQPHVDSQIEPGRSQILLNDNF